MNYIKEIIAKVKHAFYLWLFGIFLRIGKVFYNTIVLQKGNPNDSIKVLYFAESQEVLMEDILLCAEEIEKGEWCDLN